MGESQKGMAKSELVDLGEEKSPRIDREKVGALAALHRHRHEKTTAGNAHLPKPMKRITDEAAAKTIE